MNPDTTARCHEIIRRHSKSFALASRLLPPATRDCADVVYAWCRRADDAIDGSTGVGQTAALRTLERELDDLTVGRATGDPIVDGFGEVIRDYHIPQMYPRELVAGMASDVEGVRYETVDDLLLYCYRVAGTVGLMMSHVMGVACNRAVERAAHLGVAMQLTNICRDVREDWHRGRLYVPREMLAPHGARALDDRLGEPLPNGAAPALAAAVADILSIADRYYASGDAGLADLPWRSALAVAAARKIYAEIGATLRARGCDVARGRAVVGRARKLALASVAVAEGVADLPRRGVFVVAVGTSFAAPTAVLPFSDMPRLEVGTW